MKKRIKNKYYLKKSSYRHKKNGIFYLIIAVSFTILILFSPFFSSSKHNTHNNYSTILGIKSATKNTLTSNKEIYYVDCINGSDIKDGLSPNSAWRSIKKVNRTSFKPGQSLFLKRGCTWTERLIISSNGTPEENILIDAYGIGANPIINNSNYFVVSIRSSYITIQNIYAKVTPIYFESGCLNNPKGGIIGFSFESGSSYNTLKNSKVSGAYAGVFIDNNSHHNKIINNQIIDNNMMQGLDTLPDNDYGAFGILLWGDDNEVGYNTIKGSDACSYDYIRDGSAVEIYGGQRNVIQYNRGYDSDAFTELGNSRSADNVYAYNLFTSSLPSSSFLVTRGGGKYGPVYGTKALNNTIYLTGILSNAIQCVECNNTTLYLRNNILWASKNYIQGRIDEGYNIFWGSWFYPAISSTSKIADPRFVSSGVDFHLQSTSPAIDAGVQTYVNKDLDGKQIPHGLGTDIGAYEY